jgi:hypothetical protein
VTDLSLQRRPSPTCTRTGTSYRRPRRHIHEAGNTEAVILYRCPEIHMPTHYCLDPTDQYGEAQVLVTFKREGGDVKLISVIDAAHHNILSDLEEIQRQDLQHEISEAVHQPDCLLQPSRQSVRSAQG